jgi:hypothetical protein
MNLTNSREIKFKSGLVIPVNSPCEIKFVADTSICEIGSPSGLVKLSCSSLPRYFNRFKVPSMKTLEKWSFDGVAKSMLGKRVEPDGYDSEGSPSWLIVVGAI